MARIKLIALIIRGLIFVYYAGSGDKLGEILASLRIMRILS